MTDDATFCQTCGMNHAPPYDHHRHTHVPNTARILKPGEPTWVTEWETWTARPCATCGANYGEHCRNQAPIGGHWTTAPRPHARRIYLLVDDGLLTTQEVGQYPYAAWRGEA